MRSEAQPHLLIVDDDARIRALLQKYLLRNGYLVTAARDAAHARRLLAGLSFDLIVLDVMMPGEDGFSLTRHIHAQGAAPVLLLTARGEAEDRITGFEAGADDYLPKPFEPRELLLRINSILRRTPQQHSATAIVPQVLVIGPLRYDLERGELKRDDSPIRLTQTEAAIMRLFCENPGEVISREALVEHLSRDRAGHGGMVGQERAVDVQITRLRRKLEHDPKNPRHLQTVRGSGYMLVTE
ncbi:two-component system phosphate regulon response regulator OmpR [Roseinatronobacter thiooxidans]|jgi:two-component system, OmpR family, phosphate regulon response regulator OmpR|uniref:Two-component system phosphate regulon response regulator OmpR n=1 Tax=Roseinatronobacter thiooxidans TaxID=121821 RepID=A0A2W7R549_9RHOB|nr:response regulator transcription factor [Roseinatronobacter thiooxidans]PZX45775.1 two-component system phosphate regulon response regulator OmpR [Roseinatronobacter thiooxidans]